jgi:uncharacterized RDD family membrane protein YckC
MYTTASPKKRFAQYLLDILLALVTLGIGFLIWSLIAYRNGQTPAMQLMKMRVYDVTTGKTVRWRHMILRQLLIQWTVGFGITLAGSALGIIMGATGNSTSWITLILDLIWLSIDGLWILKDGADHRLTDLICKTDVVDESVMVNETEVN